MARTGCNVPPRALSLRHSSVSTGIAYAIRHAESPCLITYFVVVCKKFLVHFHAACRARQHTEFAVVGFCLHVFSIAVLVATLMVNEMRLVWVQARLFGFKPLDCATSCWPDWKHVVAHRSRIIAPHQRTKGCKHRAILAIHHTTRPFAQKTHRYILVVQRGKDMIKVATRECDLFSIFLLRSSTLVLLPIGAVYSYGPIIGRTSDDMTRR